MHTESTSISVCLVFRTTAVLLHLTDNLACFAQTLHHLHTFLAPSDSIVALLEQVVEFLRSVHLFEKFALHLIFCMPKHMLAKFDRQDESRRTVRGST